MRIQHVLLATDLSEASLAACRPVAEWAREAGFELTLLHVVEELLALPHGAPLAPPVGAPDTERRLREAERALEDQYQGLRRDLGPGFSAELEVRVAPRVADAVCERALELGADLIALSTHGRTGFRHLALGSIAEAILRRSRVPVLCFPRPRE